MIAKIDPKKIWFIDDPLKWCGLPYPGNKGCPNIGSRRKLDGFLPELKPWIIRECPSKERGDNLVFGDIFDLSRPLYLIATKFPVGKIANKYQADNPDWSLRQIYNIRYWQGRARKELKKEVTEFLLRDTDLKTRSRFEVMTNQERSGLTIVDLCPEGHGLSLVMAAKGIGIDLKFKDWPPKEHDPELVKYQMAVGGYPKDIVMLVTRGILGRIR